MKIIYPFNDGLAVVHPIAESGLSIEEIARKDVPQGVPYLIIPDVDLPEDRTLRAAWEADFSKPHGHGDPAGYWADREEAEREAHEEAENMETAP